MPTRRFADDEDFTIYLGRISVLFVAAEKNKCVMVHFNCILVTEQFTDFVSMLNDYRNRFVNANYLPENSFTYINCRSFSRLWLDNCAVAKSVYSSGTYCSVYDNFSTSDHCRLSATITLSHLPTMTKFFKAR